MCPQFSCNSILQAFKSAPPPPARDTIDNHSDSLLSFLVFCLALPTVLFPHSGEKDPIAWSMSTGAIPISASYSSMPTPVPGAYPPPPSGAPAPAPLSNPAAKHRGNGFFYGYSTHEPRGSKEGEGRHQEGDDCSGILVIFGSDSVSIVFGAHEGWRTPTNTPPYLIANSRYTAQCLSACLQPRGGWRKYGPNLTLNAKYAQGLRVSRLAPTSPLLSTVDGFYALSIYMDGCCSSNSKYV